MKLLSTGNNDIDNIIGGGIPAGTLSVIAGPPESDVYSMLVNLATVTKDTVAFFSTEIPLGQVETMTTPNVKVSSVSADAVPTDLTTWVDKKEKEIGSRIPVVIVHSMMGLGTTDKRAQWEVLTDFSKHLSDYAKDNSKWVVVTAGVQKNEASTVLSTDDLIGSRGIGNMADLVLTVKQPKIGRLVNVAKSRFSDSNMAVLIP